MPVPTCFCCCLLFLLGCANKINILSAINEFMRVSHRVFAYQLFSIGYHLPNMRANVLISLLRHSFPSHGCCVHYLIARNFIFANLMNLLLLGI